MCCIKPAIILIFISIISVHSHAQTFDKREPIDQFYEDCLRKDTSAANIRNCAYEAYGKWDKELDKYYSRLVKELKNPKDKNAFIQSQKAWLAYRDAEFNSYDNIFNKPGENWTFVRANDRVNIVKARTLQLREYYQILTAKK